MREVIFRIGLLLFCLSVIVSAGMGAGFEETLIRSFIIFFCFLTVVYVGMYVYTKSDEQESDLKNKLIEEIIKDNNYNIVQIRIEERAKVLMEERRLLELAIEQETAKFGGKHE